MLHHGFAFVYAFVVKHLRCQRYACYWCLQLVGHIVDEVVLYLSVSFLSEYDYDGEDERYEQYDGEHHGRYHEPDA